MNVASITYAYEVPRIYIYIYSIVEKIPFHEEFSEHIPPRHRIMRSRTIQRLRSAVEYTSPTIFTWRHGKGGGVQIMTSFDWCVYACALTRGRICPAQERRITELTAAVILRSFCMRRSARHYCEARSIVFVYMGLLHGLHHCTARRVTTKLPRKIIGSETCPSPHSPLSS